MDVYDYLVYNLVFTFYLRIAKLRKKTLIKGKVLEKREKMVCKIDMNHEKRLPKKPSKAFEYIGRTYVYAVK